MKKEIQDPKNKEEEQIKKRIISRLLFIRSDIEFLEKFEIKNEKIKQLIKEMKERAELLFKEFS